MAGVLRLRATMMRALLGDREASSMTLDEWQTFSQALAYLWVETSMTGAGKTLEEIKPLLCWQIMHTEMRH